MSEVVAGVAIMVVIAVIVAALVWSNAEGNRECELAGGHYVYGGRGPDECWTPDGRQRLFPPGF